jgi:hypothetical protein
LDYLPQVPPMHADSKDPARIRAVADYIYETVERERSLFNRP